MIHVATIVGARPQFVKAAAVSRAVATSDTVVETLIHTGQHFDPEMSTTFFRELEMPEPNYWLGVNGGTASEMTGRLLVELDHVLSEVDPHLVLTYGDTNSTLAGSLVAAQRRIPQAHVEAGLRSFNRSMPEEVNRVTADHLSDLLFCPTKGAVENLSAEGIVSGVHHVGDVMYDATLYAGSKLDLPAELLSKFGVEAGRYAVATLHRAGNTDNHDQLGKLIDYLRAEAQAQPIVFPVHPRTRLAVQAAGLSLDGLVCCPPLGYLEMANLVKHSCRVYTDSGGLQKEAYFFRVPCVTLRDETEWVETVQAGWNRLWCEPNYLPRREIADYGDGTASQKIVEELTRFASSTAP